MTLFTASTLNSGGGNCYLGTDITLAVVCTCEHWRYDSWVTALVATLCGGADHWLLGVDGPSVGYENLVGLIVTSICIVCGPALALFTTSALNSGGSNGYLGTDITLAVVCASEHWCYNRWIAALIATFCSGADDWFFSVDGPGISNRNRFGYITARIGAGCRPSLTVFATVNFYCSCGEGNLSGVIARLGQCKVRYFWSIGLIPVTTLVGI